MDEEVSMSDTVTITLDSDLLVHLYANYRSTGECKKCERINKVLEAAIEQMHNAAGRKHE